MAKGYVEINKKACKGCWYCVSVCPKKVLAEGDEANAKGFLTVTKANPDDCIGCGLCALMCPDCALTVFKED